ncbi:MAG: hypothetical protein WA891_18830 [Acidobacteriaceae bacterium]|jgi:hypothetical protein
MFASRKVEYDPMSRFIGPTLLLAAFALVLPVARAQQIAPIPAPLLSAQKVFLANGGADSVSMDAFAKAAQVAEPYNSLYLALQNWGHWQLLSSPDGADLILVVRFTAPLVTGPAYAPQLELTILDGKTHAPVWSLTQPVEGAFRKATWKKNYGEGIAALMGQVKTLTTPPAQTP